MSERDLSELLSRVEGATGPDRAIDGHVAVLAGWEWHGDGSVEEHAEFAGHWKQPGFDGNGSFGKRGRGLCDCKTIRPEEGNDIDCPEFTASLDAAVGLVEKMLPEMNVSVTRHSDGRGACEMWVWVSNLFDDTRALNEANGHESRHQNVGAATPALALIAALLKALIEGERTKVLSQEMGE